MLTRCPQCATTFRVTPEQLKARQGRVRCGACQEVFNALDTLVEEMPLSAVAAPEPPAPPEIAFHAAMPEAPALEAALAAPESATVAAASAPFHSEPVAPGDPEPIAEPAASFGSGTEPEPEPEAESERDAEPELEPLLHENPPQRVWPWALAACAALIVIAAQAALHFRTELAVLYPEAKPLLASVCETFGCELSLPRKPELIGIEASDLHPDADDKLALVATLKNRAPFAQEYPHLELTLTDTADQPLIRRVLAPADYLPPKTPAAAGFGANSDVAVSLAVEAPGIAAVGYRLYLFYP